MSREQDVTTRSPTGTAARRRLLFDDQPRDARPQGRQVAARRRSAHGRRHRHRRQPGGLPEAARREKGDAVVCGVEGIRVVPTFQDRDRHGFAFMTNEVSSERRVEAAVTRVAEMMRVVKAEGKKIAVVAGPVVVHTAVDRIWRS